MMWGDVGEVLYLVSSPERPDERYSRTHPLMFVVDRRLWRWSDIGHRSQNQLFSHLAQRWCLDLSWGTS